MSRSAKNWQPRDWTDGAKRTLLLSWRLPWPRVAQTPLSPGQSEHVLQHCLRQDLAADRNHDTIGAGPPPMMPLGVCRETLALTQKVPFKSESDGVCLSGGKETIGSTRWFGQLQVVQNGWSHHQ